MRSEDHAAADPDGAGLVAGAGAARSFLPPGLGAGEIDGRLRLDAGGAAAPIGAKGDDHVMHDLGVFAVRDDIDAGVFRGIHSENVCSHNLLRSLRLTFHRGTDHDVTAIRSGHRAA